MCKWAIGLALSLASVIGLGADASGAPLTIGDDAPPIAVSSWIKGEKVDKLDPDRTYVVEFWATWCGPCRVSIPHLTELQKAYKDRGVSILGISVWETDPTEVQPFLKEMGDKMDYSVAVDDVPKGEKAEAGKMAMAWMDASEEAGIPTAFIVRKGKIAWIGHPMQMDKVLEKVITDKWDLAAALGKRKEEKALEGKIGALGETLRPLLKDKKFDEAIAALDKAFADDPSLERALAVQKIGILIRGGRADLVSSYGAKLVDTLFHDEPNGLNAIAWFIVDPGSPLPLDKRDIKLALKAAERANTLTEGKDPAILDTLAKVQFDSGSPAKAVETQEKAVGLLAPGVDDNGMKDRLDQYRKAVASEKKE
ncbi:TlpA disulfide reductase family protein [Singulisphaera rosea]